MGLLEFFSRRKSSRDACPAVVEDSTPIVPHGASGRRERAADAGAAVISEALGGKLLHGWLQNRHQTLMPLTLNLSLMTQEQRDSLARILASILLAGRPADAAVELAPVLRTWFSGLGAETASLAAFDGAMETPLPLNVLFERAQMGDLTIYTYVCAQMASDTRYPVSLMLCEIIQARFDLPSALVRSAARRYRR